MKIDFLPWYILTSEVCASCSQCIKVGSSSQVYYIIYWLLTVCAGCPQCKGWLVFPVIQYSDLMCVLVVLHVKVDLSSQICTDLNSDLYACCLHNVTVDSLSSYVWTYVVVFLNVKVCKMALWWIDVTTDHLSVGWLINWSVCAWSGRDVVWSPAFALKVQLTCQRGQELIGWSGRSVSDAEDWHARVWGPRTDRLIRLFCVGCRSWFCCKACFGIGELNPWSWKRVIYSVNKWAFGNKVVLMDEWFPSVETYWERSSLACFAAWLLMIPRAVHLCSHCALVIM